MKKHGAALDKKGEGESSLSARKTDMTAGNEVKERPKRDCRDECSNRRCAYVQSPKADDEATLLD